MSTNINKRIAAALWHSAMLLATLLSFGQGSTAFAQAMPTAINLQPGQRVLLRAPAEFVAAAPDDDLSAVQHMDFAPLTHGAQSRGVTDRVYWVRLRLQNSSAMPREWVLHHESAYLDRLTVWLSDAGQRFRKVELSDREPFATRPLDYRKLGVEHTTPALAHTDVYLRVQFDKPDAMTLNFELWDAAHFHAATSKYDLIHGLYYGAMLTLLVLALLMALVLRQRLYLYYAGFLFSSALMWGLLNGHVFRHLAPEWVALHNEGMHVAFLVFAFTALLFSRGFLHTAELVPRIDRAISTLLWLLAGGIALRLAGVWEPVLWLSYVGVGSLMLLPALGAYAWYRGLRYARWYALAWLMYALGIVASVVSATAAALQAGLLPLGFTQAASLVEALMLLVALVERLTAWERDRRSALELAQIDPLTGLGNRRRLARAFRDFRERHLHTHEPVFALMLDIDHFKRINDTWGHDAGDAVLRHMADLLRKHSRPGDACIRYGGEEFAVLLSAPSLDAAVDIAERIRREFEATPTHHDNLLIEHTLSGGVAEVMSGHSALNFEGMLQRADKALYRAKSSGRNQTVRFQP